MKCVDILKVFHHGHQFPYIFSSESHFKLNILFFSDSYDSEDSFKDVHYQKIISRTYFVNNFGIIISHRFKA